VNRARSEGLHSLRMLKNNFLTAKNLIRKQEECQPRQESTYSFSWGYDEGGVIVNEDDNDE
jgi:hypothetical protein